MQRAIVVTKAVRVPILFGSRHTAFKFSRSSYLDNHLSESILGSMPGGGARGQNLVYIQKIGFLR